MGYRTVYSPDALRVCAGVPTDVAQKLITAGWAEHHSLVGKGYLPPIVIMVYGPRDDGELAIVKFAIEQSYLAAGGSLG